MRVCITNIFWDINIGLHYTVITANPIAIIRTIKMVISSPILRDLKILFYSNKAYLTMLTHFFLNFENNWKVLLKKITSFLNPILASIFCALSFSTYFYCIYCHTWVTTRTTLMNIVLKRTFRKNSTKMFSS